VFVAHLGGGTQYAMTSYGLQQITPDRVRGRIMAFELGLVTLTMSVSLLAAGRAAEVVNPTGGCRTAVQPDDGVRGGVGVRHPASLEATRARPGGPRGGTGELMAGAPDPMPR